MHTRAVWHRTDTVPLGGSSVPSGSTTESLLAHLSGCWLAQHCSDRLTQVMELRRAPSRARGHA